ncbi:MAG: hypothetical protein IPK72_21075 [Candidatus Eisenbacteria bacterium]|nr:hypothetical protein [Candidatus Eisenbacteria bacterium]
MPEQVTLTTLVPLTLSTVSGGHVERQFQEELARVREVLTDPKRSGACRVTISLDFVPEDSASFVRVLSTVSSKLPPQKLARVVTIHNGELMEDRTSPDARQPGLFAMSAEEVRGE